MPDLNDFVAGLAIMLRPGGVLTIEAPHLLRLIQDNQFDRIYHEHFSYFSLLAAGLRWDDPAFGIAWPVSDPILSSRDRLYPDWVTAPGRSAPARPTQAVAPACTSQTR